MKKILITFFVLISLSISNISYAECIIESWPTDSLETYIKDLRKVVTNVTREASREERWIKVRNEILRWMNSIISSQDYITEFDFYIYESIFSEIPSQIKRDDKMLSKEIENLEKYLWVLSKRWLYKVNITNACDWVKWYCSLSWNAWDIIVSLLGNTKKIKNWIQISTTWKSEYDLNNLVLTNEKLVSDIKTVYKNAKSECSNADWGFFWEIKKKITDIAYNNKEAEDWIKEWQEAWSMLVWSVINKNPELEKELLAKELKRQWVPSDQAQTILDNLDKYNNWWWYSLQNNPISNTFRDISNSISTQWNSFSESISEWFWDDNKESLAIKDLINNSQKIEISNTIKNTIEKKYKEQLIFAQMQDTNTTKIVWKIISIHNSLWLSINELEKTISISEKVCCDQNKDKCDICKF